MTTPGPTPDPLAALERALMDFDAFVIRHISHADFGVDAQRVSPAGYRVTATCCDGARIDRWITKADADAALARLDAGAP